MPEKGQFIVISSGAGGPGKTWLTGGLGACLADRNQRCLLVDGSWGFSGLAEQLGLKGGVPLDAAMDGKVRPAETVHSVRGGAGHGGFDVAFSAMGLDDCKREHVERFVQTLKWFTSEYDFVLLDRPSRLSAEMIILAAEADRAILIVRDDPHYMTDAYAHLKVAMSYRSEARIELLANAVETEPSGRRCMTAIQNACLKYLSKAPAALGTVFRDERAGEAAKAQTPFPWLYPDSPASLAIGEVADTLIAQACDT